MILRLAAAAVLLASPLSAQLLRGVVRATDSLPQAGAVVTVLGGTGSPIARTFVRENGFFEVRVPGAGRYVLTVDRTGFETALLPPVEVKGLVADAGTLVPEDRRVTLGAAPSVEAPCRMGLDVQGRALDLLLAARHGFVAVALAESSRQPLREVVRWQRTYDIDGKKMSDERKQPPARVSERPFFAPSADSVAKKGYVHGDSTYFAFDTPDARLMASDLFIAGHCFREVATERTVEGKALVGLGFAPIGTPKVTEIEGVIWLERETGRLAEVEFSYAPQPAKKGRFGGRQRFAETPGTRLPYVAQWAQRLPLFGLRPTDMPRAVLNEQGELRNTIVRELNVTGMREDGGEVVRLL